MSLFSMLKRNSKLALRGFWGRAILASAIVAGATVALSAVQKVLLDQFAPPVRFDAQLALRYGFSEFFFEQFAQTSLLEWGILALFVVLELLLTVPLTMGVYRWHLLLVQGSEPGIGEMFYFFENARRFGRAIWLHVNLLARCIVWALLLLLLPGGILTASLGVLGMGEISRSLGAAASVGVVLGTLMLLLTLFLFAAWINRYLPALYLLCEGDNTPVRGVIRESVRVSKGYRFSLLWFQLSFIGWGLLCVFVLPALYVVPYFYTSVAMYAKYMIERSRYVPENTTREFRPDEEEPPVGTAPATQEPAQRDDADAAWAPADSDALFGGDWEIDAEPLPKPDTDAPDEAGQRAPQPPEYRQGPLPAPEMSPFYRPADPPAEQRRDEEEDPAIWPDPDQPFRDRQPPPSPPFL